MGHGSASWRDDRSVDGGFGKPSCAWRAQDENEFTYWPDRHKAVSGIPASIRSLLLEPVDQRGGWSFRSAWRAPRRRHDIESLTQVRHSERSSGSHHRVRLEDAFSWDRSEIGCPGAVL